MASSVLSKRTYRFGLFQVDPAAGTLLRQGLPVKLQEQPFRVLCLLLDRAGEVVTREDLRQSLWPQGTYVEFDGSLNAALKRLRFALGDDADNPIFIETVPRRGYKFIAPVACDQPEELESAAKANGQRLPASEQTGATSHVSQIKNWWWIVAALAVVALVIGSRSLFRPSTTTPPPAPKVIAVLPFSNEGAGPDFDYLRFAIPNDLVSDISSTHSISVRPLASTTRFAGQAIDPAAIGSELRVTHVLAGGFLIDNKNLHINMELVDVARNQPVWRSDVIVPPQQMVAMQDQIAVRTAQGLLPALNISGASTSEMPSSRNERAVDLFLHSLTIPLDPDPNRIAIQKLEQAVSLDPRYAAAWGELGWRYYIDYHYGNGGESSVDKALQAYKRQSEIDPDSPSVSTTIRVEQGDLLGAYRQASDLLQRHPNASLAHYGMSYVLRYAGLLDEAGKECDQALAIDPGFNVFRSCAFAFVLNGDFTHAQAYIRLDEHSGFTAAYRMLINLRMGDSEAALHESETASRNGVLSAGLANAYLSHAPSSDISKAAAAIEANPGLSRDAEELYQSAEVLSFTGQGSAALRQLQRAIQRGYCSYPAMDKDPLFDPIRQQPEFATLRQSALQCQQNFLAHR
jgi:DNA-binding winged helix-turn-helix (wHTH) protein/TolB-like protein